MKSFILALLASLVTANILQVPNIPTAYRGGLKRRGVGTIVAGQTAKQLGIGALKSLTIAAFKTFRPALVKTAYTSFTKVVPAPGFLSKFAKARPVVKSTASLVAKVSSKKLIGAPPEAINWIKLAKTFRKRLLQATAVELAFTGLFMIGGATYTVVLDEYGKEKNITIDPVTGLPLPDESGKQSVYSNTTDFYHNGKPSLILDPNTQISYYLNTTTMKYYCLDVQTEEPKYYSEDNTDSCKPATQNSGLSSSTQIKTEMVENNSTWSLEPESGDYYRVDANGDIKWKPFEVINGTEYFKDKENGQLYSIDQAGNIKYKPDRVENGVEYFLDKESGDYWYTDDKGVVQWEPYYVENGVNYFLDKTADRLYYYDADNVSHYKIELTEGGKVYYKEVSTGLLFYVDDDGSSHYKPDLVEGGKEWVKEPGTGRYFNYDANGKLIYRTEGSQSGDPAVAAALASLAAKSA